MRRLEGAVDGNADVGGLLVGEGGEADAEGVEVEPGDLLVEVLGEHIDLVLVVVGLVNSSIWRSSGLNELDMTNDGWPVALPRLRRRPSERTMMACRRGTPIRRPAA